MLQHLYAHEYSGSQESSGGVTETSFISELHTHVKMYALADEYDIKDLKIEASRNFTAAMVDKEGQGDDVTAVLKVIPAIYTTTPDSDRGLRDFAVEFCAQHLERMKDLPELEDVVFQAPKFMVEVLPLFFSKFQQKLSPVWEHCRRCGDTEGCVKYTRVSCDRCGYERILSTGERMAAFK